MSGFPPAFFRVMGLGVAAMAAISCGSGGSDSALQGADFRSEIGRCESPPANAVYLCRNTALSDGEAVAVDVRVNSDSPVFGMAADLTFDPERVTPVRKTDQSLDYSLPDGTVWKRTFVSLQRGKADTLVLGVSRQKGDLPITGSVPVVTVKFRVISGESPVDFTHNGILGENGRPMVQVEHQWYGGTLIGGNEKRTEPLAGKGEGR